MVDVLPEVLFAEWAVRVEAGENLDCADLLRAHPEHADELRRLHDDWALFAPLLGRVVPGLLASNAEFVVAPLSRDDQEALVGPSSELLERLRIHVPSSGHYRFRAVIGCGGGGVVLKVWDTKLNRPLAMKVVLGRGTELPTGDTPPVDGRSLARFVDEARIASQLDHPGIVPVHELGADEAGRAFFTMKLVKGEDLRQIYEHVLTGKDGWNQTRALGVLLKVCEAMSYAHDKGVIHRDLKPANVMVGKFGEVYVMDWGLARVLGKRDQHDLRLRSEAQTRASVRTERRDEREEAPDSPIVTRDGDVVGTPAYMSPEQARGDTKDIGPPSDVYAVGAMLYHLLALQMPFVPRNATVSARTVLMRVLEGPPLPVQTLAPDAPAELVAICEKAMGREASMRYPDTLAMANDLRAFLEHRVVSAYETGTWAETRKWVQRNRALAASLAAAVVLLSAGLTTSLVFKTSADRRAADLLAANAALDAETKTAQANERTAQEQAALAAAQEAQAQREKANVLKLSAFQTLDDLTREAEELWPAEPRLLERYREWMRKAEALGSQLPEFRSALVEIEQRALPQSAEVQDSKAGPGSEPTGRRTWRFAVDAGGSETGDRWWHDEMLKLVAELEAFSDPETGLMRGFSEAHGWSVGKRLEFASNVEERTLGGQAKRLWSEALAAIVASPKYGGLHMTPQMGLLPIGADPESGLWEFAHLQSGEPAVRGSDGRLRITEGTGVVFVLIPGGTFWMGAQKADPGGRNYDPQARDNESPVHEVVLSPYFLSKYEMTQGQWKRFTGHNPSNYGPASKHNGHQHDLTHPVEQVKWPQCMEVMSRLGLELPSEAQWECGSRGGTGTPWWTGADRESLRGKANLADQTAAKAGAPWEDIKDWPDLVDGWVVHAPVGSLPANPYGLHEVLGNVWEWCRDGYAQYPAAKQVDPMRAWGGDPSRVTRGGCFNDTAFSLRSALREHTTPDSQSDDIGLRPARAVTP